MQYRLKYYSTHIAYHTGRQILNNIFQMTHNLQRYEASRDVIIIVLLARHTLAGCMFTINTPSLLNHNVQSYKESCTLVIIVLLARHTLAGCMFTINTPSLLNHNVQSYKESCTVCDHHCPVGAQYLSRVHVYY